MKLNRKDLSLIKKSLRICIVKFSRKWDRDNDIDAKILSSKFEDVLEKTRKIPIEREVI
tara:strand:+ start:821 stop:997 length:177 start_codon:yes stop_codon:yes gene_type:complete